MKTSLRNVVNDFLLNEEKFSLFKFSYKGEEIWPAIRYYFFLYYAKRKKCWDDISIKSDNRIFQNPILILTIIKNVILHNPLKILLFRKKYNTIVFPHNRSIKFDEKFIDPSTYFWIKENKDKENIVIFEKPYAFDHIRRNEIETVYLDSIFIIREFFSLFWFFLPNPKIYELKGDFLDNNEYKYLIKIIKKNYLRIIVGRFIYYRIFKIVQPEKCIFVASYINYSDPIYTANKLGIKTIEIQHGLVSNMHMGYHVPGNIRNDFYVKTFWAWNNKWFDHFENPFETIRSVGNNYFDLKKSRIRSKEQPNRVLIISQTSLCKKICTMLLANENQFWRGKQIVYRPHPEESTSIPGLKHLYQKLVSKGITIEKENDLYEEISMSQFVVGVYSTVLIEAMSLGKKVIVLKFPGYENFESYTDANNMFLWDMEKDLHLKDLNPLNLL